MSPHARQFFERVEKACRGTPYEVTETARGFDLEIDLGDETWHQQLQESRLSEVYTHHVAVPSRNSFSIIEEVRTIIWTGDTPRTALTGRRRVERDEEPTARHIWASMSTGERRDISSLGFSSDEGRDLITSIAEQLGFRQRAARIEGLGHSIAIGLIITLATITALLGIAVILKLLAGLPPM